MHIDSYTQIHTCTHTDAHTYTHITGDIHECVENLIKCLLSVMFIVVPNEIGDTSLNPE